ncbi:neutral zinc metallopeptidase [Streptosporangium sp. NPDC049376]|uniref:neutral zinc metallopeptidase n=1 Tax=Streptosporangium sp. NPDC049376 TaxID=3366192 RepID=UPI0037B33E5B
MRTSPSGQQPSLTTAITASLLLVVVGAVSACAPIGPFTGPLGGAKPATAASATTNLSTPAADSPAAKPSPQHSRLSGGAQREAPTGRAAATTSPLYRVRGVSSSSRCLAGGIREGSASSYRTFMTRITRCLDRVWRARLTAAGLPFSRPALRFTTTTKVTSPCGRWPAKAAGFYCSTNRTIYIGVLREALSNPYPINHAQFMAHEYGHHVQKLMGVMDYYGRSVWNARLSTKLAFSRRLELQADCLGSAFLRQVSADLSVEQADWDSIIEWVTANGHKNWIRNDHGKGRNQAYWMQRGFEVGSPSACNTWSASASTVS